MASAAGKRLEAAKTVASADGQCSDIATLIEVIAVRAQEQAIASTTAELKKIWGALAADIRAEGRQEQALLLKKIIEADAARWSSLLAAAWTADLLSEAIDLATILQAKEGEWDEIIANSKADDVSKAVARTAGLAIARNALDQWHEYKEDVGPWVMLASRTELLDQRMATLRGRLAATTDDRRRRQLWAGWVEALARVDVSVTQACYYEATFLAPSCWKVRRPDPATGEAALVAIDRQLDAIDSVQKMMLATVEGP